MLQEGSQGTLAGQPGSKLRAILRRIQHAYSRRIRRTGGGTSRTGAHDDARRSPAASAIRRTIEGYEGLMFRGGQKVCFCVGD
jgi:hypothetical protein